MKGLKFRAFINIVCHTLETVNGVGSTWHSKECMCEVLQLNISKGSMRVRWSKGNTADVQVKNIMQFTGLKDRKGVDIYEGDILKCDFSRDNNGMHDSIQVVEFYEGSFGSRNKNDHFRIPALFSGRATEGMNLNYYEVIGNIHEHPNLIP